MLDGLAVVGGLIWLSLIGVWLAHERWRRNAVSHIEARVCSRCATAPVMNEPVGERPRRTMCDDCRRITQRNYRAGSFFFYGVGALFIIMAPFIVFSETRDFGIQTGLLDVAIFVCAISLTGGAAWAIRYFGGKVA